VVVIATTTDISYIDEALLRSGRLEEHLLVDLPDPEQRKKIIQYYISKYFSKFFDIGAVNSSSSDSSDSGDSRADTLITIVDELMKMSDGKSGAFIRQIIQEISMNAIRLYVSEKIASKGADSVSNEGGQGGAKDGKVAVDLALIRKCIDMSFLDVKEKAKITSSSGFKNVAFEAAL
jgi:SpoVK/Ycf46/Vps4 family AAA+-type ATPase